MLLTLSKPARSEFDYKTHEYSPPFSSSSFSRFSPKFNGGPVSSLPVSTSSTMATPHRALPPPSSMNLPEPGRGQSQMVPSLGALPPAPPHSHWQGSSEDESKNWLIAKAEEDRRKQEEEKTRQESLRLEQESLRLERRKIEQSMLRESMQGGIPPHLVPMIFAGIGGGNLGNMTAEWVQQYSSQLQTAQQAQTQGQAQQQALPQSQASPVLHRETRLLREVPSGPYASAPPTPQTVRPPTSVLPGQPLATQSEHAVFSNQLHAIGNTSPRARERARTAQSIPRVGALTSAPRPPQQSQLSRLTTNEMIIQPLPTGPFSSVQQPQQPSLAQREQSPIYFHHWVPPTSQHEKSSSGNPPATPSGKYKASSFPPRQRAASYASAHASDPDFTSSPKKRKAQGGHPAPPPPSAHHSQTSPAYSQFSSNTSTPRRGHARGRSDISTRGTESHTGTLSRRGTIMGHGYEPNPHQPDIPEQRYQQPPREAESHYQQSYAPHQEQAHTSAFPRNDGRGDGQQARAPTPTPIQHETRQSAIHHHLHGTGSVPTSPKREVRG